MSKFTQARQREDEERREAGEPTALSTHTRKRVVRSTSPSANITPLPLHGREPASQPSRPLADSLKRIDVHLVSILEPTSFEAEQYRALCQRLEQRQEALKVIAVSSPAMGDGKTTTVLNIAGSLASIPNTRVLVIDLDLRRPTIAQYLGLSVDPEHSIVSALQNATPLDSVIQEEDAFDFHVVGSAGPLSAPFDVLRLPHVGELFQEARMKYDYVIVDVPPLTPLPDCHLIEQWVDGFLMVVNAHKTPKHLVEEAAGIIETSKMIGCLFNADSRSMAKYNTYYTDNRYGRKS